jgi:hypothetical protein
VRLTDRTYFTFGIFVLILVFVVLSLNYQPRARFVPLAIGIPTLVLALFQLLIDLIPAVGRRFSFFQEYDVFGIEAGRAAENSREQEERSARTIHRRELSFAAWLLLLVALIYFLGYLAAIALFLPLFLKLRSSEGWRMTLSITVVTWGFVYVIFILIMDAPLHEGLLWNILARIIPGVS